MPDLFDNPLGLQGFEFIEFASPTPGVLEPVFQTLGFTRVAEHRSKDVSLYRQGQINFIVNREPKSPAGYFAAEHGPSACGLAFRVADSHKAYAMALERGAQPVEMPTGPMELRLPAIRGIGGAPLYLIDRYEDGESIYDIDFRLSSTASSGARWATACRSSTTSRTTSTAAAWRTGPRSTSACSTFARSATSTSRARTPG